MYKNSSKTIAPVTVVIPVYNCERYITKAIDSVLCQTILPERMIVVNDGSSDQTESVIMEHLKEIRTDARIDYYYKNNGGHSSARNFGIMHNKSEYIAFLDSDDVWNPNKLQEQLDVFKKSKINNLGLVYCDFDNIDSNGVSIKSKNYFVLDKSAKGNVAKKLMCGNIIAGSSSAVLIKSECFRKVGLFDESLIGSEDWFMWYRIARHYNFDYTPSKLVFIRHHNDNISKQSREMLKSSLILFNKFCESKDFDKSIVRFWADSFFISVLYYDLKDIIKLKSPSMHKIMSKKANDIFFNNLLLITKQTLKKFYEK